MSTEADKSNFNGGFGELEATTLDGDRKHSLDRCPVNSHLESPVVGRDERSTLSVDKIPHKPAGSIISMASTPPQVYEPYRPPEKSYVQLIRSEKERQMADASKSKNIISSDS